MPEDTGALASGPSFVDHNLGSLRRPVVEPAGIFLLQVNAPVTHSPPKVVVPIGPMQRIAPVEEHGMGYALQAISWPRHRDTPVLSEDAEGALEAFAQAEQQGANALDVAVGRSAALLALQALDQAQALLQAAMLSAPEDARLYNNLGLVAQARGDPDEARELFERAAELAPEWDLPRQNLEALGP